MKIHLISLGYSVWKITKKKYTIPENGPLDEDEVEQYELNGKARGAC